MARLNDDGQWIILMGLIICIVLIMLALIVNESMLVGKTTSESVLEFSKSDILDIKDEVSRVRELNLNPAYVNAANNHIRDMERLSLARKSILLEISDFNPSVMVIHFNNGVNQYEETLRHL
jgi:hypothetical protein